MQIFKNRTRTGLVILLCGFFAAPLFAVAAETIRSYNTVAEISPDGLVHITETIGYDFAEQERHGIFRTIPLFYEFEDRSYELDISDVVVSSPTGAPSDSQISWQGDEVRLRIGDPDTTIRGAHQYVVEYTVGNALRAHEGSYEFYWNTTGNEWDVSIDTVETTVMLPSSISSDRISYACYEGPLGGTNQCARTEEGGGANAVTHLVFHSQNLGPGEGSTVAVEFPDEFVSGYTHTPHQSNVITILAISAAAVLILGGFLFWFWYRFGKDPQGRGVIVRQYTAPEGLSPAELGVVVDERVHDRDITAEIVSLAQKSYIHILSFSKKILFFNNSSYIIFQLKEPDGALKEHEQLILKRLFKSAYSNPPESLFEEVPKQTEISQDTLKELAEKSLRFVMLKDLKNSFHKDVREVRKKLYKELTEEGYFERNPQKTIQKFTIGSVVLLFALWFLSADVLGGLGMVIILAAYFFMSMYVLTLVKKTSKGVEVKEHGLGLKQYLTMAEKERMEFHFDPRKNPELFEKLLPYAIALNVDKQWANQFDGIYQKEPTWYTGTHSGGFSSTAFVSELSTLSEASQGSSSSGSSGGGFSGGGAGGGGGGSW